MDALGTHKKCLALTCTYGVTLQSKRRRPLPIPSLLYSHRHTARSYRSLRSMQPPNIYIVGAQSTGKTTLTLALVERIQRDQNAGRQTSIPTPAVITEVARRVMEKHGFETQETFASADRVTHLQQLILDAQLQEQRQVQQGTWFISDRSGNFSFPQSKSCFRVAHHRENQWSLSEYAYRSRPPRLRPPPCWPLRCGRPCR